MFRATGNISSDVIPTFNEIGHLPDMKDSHVIMKQKHSDKLSWAMIFSTSYMTYIPFNIKQLMIDLVIFLKKNAGTGFIGSIGY